MRLRGVVWNYSSLGLENAHLLFERSVDVVGLGLVKLIELGVGCSYSCSARSVVPHAFRLAYLLPVLLCVSRSSIQRFLGQLV